MQRDIEQWKPSDVARLLALVETERRYYQDLFSALPVAVAVLEASGAFVAVNREFRRLVGIEAPRLGRARITDYVDAPGLAAALAKAALEGEEAEPLDARTRSGEDLRLTIAPAGGWSAEGLKEVVAVLGPAAGSARPSAAPPATVLWRVETGQEPAAPGEVFAPDLQARQRFYIDRAKLGVHESFDYRVRTPQGRLILICEHTLLDGPATWGFTIDVTEIRIRDAERAERARREAAERLASRVAHVSNNLLMIVNGYGEEILGSFHEADTRREDMQEILKASARLAALTQELSSFARPPHYEASTVALQTSLPGMAERLRALLPDGVTLTAAPAAATVLSNAGLLERMLAEALRYLAPWLRPENSCLLEAAPPEQDRCRLILSLPGVRLDAEAASRMFEPFSGARAGADPSLGIAGLVRPFESLGGSIHWDLADPAQPRLVLECAVAVQSAQTAASGRTILVVEDEPGIRHLIVKSLARHGYSVIQAANPVEALQLTAGASAGPDLLISDLTIPGMDGRTFAARLRERWPALPVLYVSGFTGDPELGAQLSRGALPPNTRFLAKPFSTGDLLDAVNALLARAASAGS